MNWAVNMAREAIAELRSIANGVRTLVVAVQRHTEAMERVNRICENPRAPWVQPRESDPSINPRAAFEGIRPAENERVSEGPQPPS